VIKVLIAIRLMLVDVDIELVLDSVERGNVTG